MANRLAPLLLALVAPTLVAACGAPDGSDGPDETTGQTAAAVTTFANDEAAFDFFVGKGLTAAQAAGEIVGNLDVESGVEPAVVEAGGPDAVSLVERGSPLDTTAGDNATAYARKEGEPLLSLMLQLQFIWFELTTFPEYGLATLKATTTVSAATSAFTTYYEGCGVCSGFARLADAENVLAAYGDDVGKGDPDGGGADAAVACTVTAVGGGEDVTGVCLDISACAALGAHLSTAGACPGAASIECCTATGSGGTSTEDGGAAGGGAIGAVDGSTDGGATSGGRDGDAADGETEMSSGGCDLAATKPRGLADDGLGCLGWLVGLAALRSRRRSFP